MELLLSYGTLLLAALRERRDQMKSQIRELNKALEPYGYSCFKEKSNCYSTPGCDEYLVQDWNCLCHVSFNQQFIDCFNYLPVPVYRVIKRFINNNHKWFTGKCDKFINCRTATKDLNQLAFGDNQE